MLRINRRKLEVIKNVDADVTIFRNGSFKYQYVMTRALRGNTMYEQLILHNQVSKEPL